MLLLEIWQNVANIVSSTTWEGLPHAPQAIWEEKCVCEKNEYAIGNGQSSFRQPQTNNIPL